MTTRLEVYRPETGDTAFGGARVEGWHLVGVWWAERTSMSGRERTEVGEGFNAYTTRFNLDIRHHIEEDWQVGYEGRRYRVTAIVPNRGRGLQTIECERDNE